MRQLVAAVPERNALIAHVKRLVISRPCSILQPGETGVFHRTHIHVPCEGESPHLMSSGLNGAKMSKIWGSLLPRRGYRILAQGSAQGFNPGNRPAGRRALKGRQVIVISNRREKHISMGPRHRSTLCRCPLLASGRLYLPPNKCPIPFL